MMTSKKKKYFLKFFVTEFNVKTSIVGHVNRILFKVITFLTVMLLKYLLTRKEAGPAIQNSFSLLHNFAMRQLIQPVLQPHKHLINISKAKVSTRKSALDLSVVKKNCPHGLFRCRLQDTYCGSSLQSALRVLCGKQKQDLTGQRLKKKKHSKPHHLNTPSKELIVGSK